MKIQRSGEGHFDYEYLVGQNVVIPLLNRLGVIFERKHIHDIGCGSGGVAAALAERFPSAVISGSDIRVDRINTAREISRDRHIACNFFVEDIETKRPDSNQLYDVVIMRDVIEHVSDPSLSFKRVLSRVRPGGKLFISFPPWYSPFGGHQHGHRLIPWLHLFPRWLQNLFIRDPNSWKILKTGLNKVTIRHFENILATEKVTNIQSIKYLSRPVFKVKYGLPTVRLMLVDQIPVLKEFFTTGAVYLITK